MNVGSGNTYSVLRLVELLGGEKVHMPKRPGEPDCTFADTSKIERLLGWRPRVSSEEGVAAMLRQIDYWREAPVWTVDGFTEASAVGFKYLGRQPIVSSSRPIARRRAYGRSRPRRCNARRAPRATRSPSSISSRRS